MDSSLQKNLCNPWLSVNDCVETSETSSFLAGSELLSHKNYISLIACLLFPCVLFLTSEEQLFSQQLMISSLKSWKSFTNDFAKLRYFLRDGHTCAVSFILPFWISVRQAGVVLTDLNLGFSYTCYKEDADVLHPPHLRKGFTLIATVLVFRSLKNMQISAACQYFWHR